MPKKQPISQNDLDISLNQMESLARILLPILREYLASDQGKKDWEKWQLTHNIKDGSNKPSKMKNAIGI